MKRTIYPRNINIISNYNEQTFKRNIIIHNIDTVDHEINKKIISVKHFWTIVRLLYLFKYDFCFNLFDEENENETENKGYFTFGVYNDIVFYDDETNIWTICEGECKNDDLLSNESLFYLLLEYSGKKTILEKFIRIIKKKLF